MICYSGYLSANSGMGEACRNYVMALEAAGVQVTTDLIPNVKSTVNLGEKLTEVRRLFKTSDDYNIKIIHVTPDAVTPHLEPMKYHIFHLFWETDSLPKWWVWALNLVDEVWTGTEWNKQAFIKSGVTKPIYVFPQALNTNPPPARPFKISTIENDKLKKYIFYSIFQWIERKDPWSLLEAYWREFERERDVLLLLKTYRDRFDREDSMGIVKQIYEFKNRLGLKDTPEVNLYTDGLDRFDMLRLHETGNCFVSAHRGEGWGIPEVEAMAHGKPVINTNLGGFNCHVPSALYWPVSYIEENVHDMNYVPWYDQSQKWGKINISELRKAMREVYENQLESKRRAKKAQDWVKEHFNFKSVGEQMSLRLDEIERNLV